MIPLINGAINYGFRVTRKAKIYKVPHYGGIPHYNKPYFVDVHGSYKLRSFEEVKKELEELEINVQIENQLYNVDDMAHQVKSRKTYIYFSLDQFNFTELQLDRFKILMGPRYLQQKNEGRIICESHPQFNQNMQKALEQFRDVILQSKRAP